MKIICVGEALIDMICPDKGMPLSEATQFIVKPGGAPTNVAAAIAALGGEAELAAKVGNDAFGKKLIAVMEEFGVATRWMIRSDTHFTTLAFVSLMENGERDFVFSRGADGELTREEVDRIGLDDVSILHFGSATAFLPGPLQTAYQSLLQKALQRNLLISFDPNYRHLLFHDKLQSFIDQSWNFLTACHFFKLSDEEALLLTGAHTLADATAALMQKTTAVFAITLGKDGTLLRKANETVVVPSIPIEAVDTTGAGDAFVGAVLYQLGDKTLQQVQQLAMADWKTIVAHANKAGARTCEYLGAMEAFRHLNSRIFE
ncbi:MAG: carbohydrate kinase [Chitinophagaceae bacterium]|nr:carbohydrate kinase [Chitinophagaceae bacterium]